MKILLDNKELIRKLSPQRIIYFLSPLIKQIIIKTKKTKNNNPDLVVKFSFHIQIFHNKKQIALSYIYSLFLIWIPL